MLAALCCLTAGPALGCAYHGIPDLQLQGLHPGSLSVAVALRNAADAGVIDADALVVPVGRGGLHIDTVRRLQAFRSAIAAYAEADKLPQSFSLVFVESSLWTRYTRAGQQVRADIHNDGPANEEAVVLTGEPVLQAILDGRLSSDRALDQGLLVIDANENERTALRRALAATSRLSASPAASP